MIFHVNKGKHIFVSEIRIMWNRYMMYRSVHHFLSCFVSEHGLHVFQRSLKQKLMIIFNMRLTQEAKSFVELVQT